MYSSLGSEQGQKMTSKKYSAKPLIRAPLDKESVIRAAIKLADEGGLVALSMRKLGHALGVEGMALYHHFANKESLIDGMVDSVHAEIAVPTIADHWRVAMRARAMSALNALSRHMWAAPIMESRHNPGPASMQLIDATIKCWLNAGFNIEMVAHIISVLDAYTIGFAQQLRSPTDSIEQEAQMGKDIMAKFPFDLYPHVGRLVSEVVAKAGYRSVKEFEFGLELILDAIAQLEPAK
jgi:AcrR family transcriptional regulator